MLAVDARHFMLHSCINAVTLRNLFRCRKEQGTLILDIATDEVRQATICERNMAGLLEYRDTGQLVHAPGTSRRTHATGYAANDDYPRFHIASPLSQPSSKRILTFANATRSTFNDRHT